MASKKKSTTGSQNYPKKTGVGKKLIIFIIETVFLLILGKFFENYLSPILVGILGGIVFGIITSFIMKGKKIVEVIEEIKEDPKRAIFTLIVEKWPGLDENIKNKLFEGYDSVVKVEEKMEIRKQVIYMKMVNKLLLGKNLIRNGKTDEAKEELKSILTYAKDTSNNLLEAAVEPIINSI